MKHLKTQSNLPPGGTLPNGQATNAAPTPALPTQGSMPPLPESPPAMVAGVTLPTLPPPLPLPPEKHYNVLYCDFNDWFMPHATFNWPQNQLTINRYVAATLNISLPLLGTYGHEFYAVARVNNQIFELHLYTEKPVDPDLESTVASLTIAENGKDWHMHLHLESCQYLPLIYGPLLLYLSTESSNRHLVLKSIYPLPQENHLADAHRFTVKSLHAK